MLSFLSALLPAAQAILPPQDSYQGIEPQWPPRVADPGSQRRLRNTPAWSRFLQETDGTWQARFDEVSGGVTAAWGKGLDIGPVQDSDEARATLLRWIQEHEDLLGVSHEDLVLKAHAHTPKATLVEFQQTYQGVPVWRSGVMGVFQGGRLIQLRTRIQQPPSIDTEPSLSLSEALSVALDSGPAPDTARAHPGGRLVIIPVQGERRMALSWEVKSESETPLGEWVSFVDAHEGQLLKVYNEVRFLSGTLEAEHHVRHPNSSTTNSPLPYARISSDDGTVYTDLSGAFSLSGESFSASMRGTYVTMNNSNGSAAELSFDDSSSSLLWTEDDATMAELDSYVFLHQIREWALIYAPDVNQIVNGTLRAYVNVTSGSCNAYWNGTVNFYAAQGSCNNTGQIADVNYHEWGHGFHYYSVVAGSVDGSMGEGIGDISSVLLTDDSVIGPYFYTSGSGIRDVEPDRVYPEDVVNQVHTDGLIFGGSVWDLLAELEASYGNRTDALDVASHLFAQGIKSGPDIEGSYDAFLAADDDDGDLSNGTPHQCELINAFGMHGLGPGGSGALLELGHQPLADQAPGQLSYPVTASLTNIAPDCVEITADSARLHYSVDGGETWDDVELTMVDDESVEGAIPGQPQGSVVQYYLEVETEENTAFAPTDGSRHPFTFFVGELVPVYCEDFEVDDGGYDHELVSGEESEGADDWTWGSPAGLSDDPTAASSGSMVWANDLGITINGQPYNGAYQAEKHNRLISTEILLDTTDIEGEIGGWVLGYQRWLTIEDGYYDQAWITADGEDIWSNHVSEGSNRDDHSEHHIDDQWMPHVLEIEDLDEDGSVVITWELQSDGGLEYGGWNVDDVCVYAWIVGEDSIPGDDSGAPWDEDDSGWDAEGDSGEGGLFPGQDDDSGLSGDLSGDEGDELDLVILSGGCSCDSSDERSVAPLWLLGMLGLFTRRRR